MKVAVTGAGGLLGAALVNRLAAGGQRVLAMSRSPGTVASDNAVHWDASDDWRQTARALVGVDVVLHTAAYIPRDHSDASEALRCLEVNGIGTLNLLRAAELADVRRFVYVSGSNTLKPRTDRVREDDPIGCEHAPYYLGSKVVGEIYVRAAMEQGLETLVVRPSSIYGPGMTGGVLATFANRLRDGLPIRLNNGGRFQADYVWRSDVVEVLARCAVDHRRGALNLGAGTVTSLREVAHLLCEVLGADPGLVTVEPAGDEARTTGFAAIDIARAREWYAFAPTSLRDGLKVWFGASGTP
jgi:UDP-glucose 4-epimerase